MELSATPSDPKTPSRLQCLRCRHLVAWPYCFAFLTESGIPDAIRSGESDHSLPYPGDHGIRFLPVDSPYELSEEAFKRLIVEYKGCVVMPFPAELHDRDDAATATVAALTEITEPEPARPTDVSAPASAVQQEHEIVEERVDSVANIEPEVSEKELLSACARGDLRTIEWLLDQGVEVDVKDNNNNTALMVACRNCHVEVARLLLQRGADVNARDNYGRTAMDIAADWGYPSIIALVREYGGKVSDPLYR